MDHTHLQARVLPRRHCASVLRRVTVQLGFLLSTLLQDMKHDATDRFMRDTKRGCNGTERFFLLGNTLHNCHPLGSRNTIFRVLWSWPPMLDNGRMTQVFHPQQVGAVPFDTVSQTGRGRGRTLVTENSTPRRFRHIAFSPDAVPRSARSWRVPASCSPLFLLLA